MKHLFFLLLSFTAAICTYSQDQPIGYWRSHTPYTDLRGIATDGVSIYVVTKESFYSYNAAADEIHAYSKTDGMSDIGRSEEHTSELQSRENLVCRLLLEKK